MLQLTQLRVLRERREHRARQAVDECRRAEQKPRAVMSQARAALETQHAERKQASERLKLQGGMATSVGEQMDARVGLARIDVRVVEKTHSLDVAQKALDLVVNATSLAETSLRAARTNSEKSEHGLERHLVFIRKEELSQEEALLDEQTDAHVLARYEPARTR